MCGIAGIINKSPRVFDYSGFCTLGIANDSRGGDSCGVFIDGKYDYGVKDLKLFQDFFIGTDFLDNIKESKIALLHCRKASVGNVSLETAQPVIIKDSEGTVKFVVLHNGTIYNYKELAEKYIPDIDIKDMTDSQVMARIFYYAGYDVLEEYNGGAVFAIVDYREDEPRTFLFKGASKKSSYTTTVEDERPLYYTIDADKEEMIFSSIYQYLYAIRRDSKVYICPENQLIEFTGKVFTLVRKVDRSKCTQTKEFVHKSPVSRYIDDYDFGDYYGRGYSNYITTDIEKNLYSKNDKLLHGIVLTNKWGRISKRPIKGETYEMWFFRGVPLKNKECFRFLTLLEKKSKLPIKDFGSLFENVIRFLSIDGIYKESGLWYKAITPTRRIEFTGKYQPVGCITCVTIDKGVKISSGYNTEGSSSYDIVNRKYIINFDEVEKGCGQLMKLLKGM